MIDIMLLTIVIVIGAILGIIIAKIKYQDRKINDLERRVFNIKTELKLGEIADEREEEDDETEYEYEYLDILDEEDEDEYEPWEIDNDKYWTFEDDENELEVYYEIDEYGKIR